MRDRRVVRHSAVHQKAAVVLDSGQDAGDRRAHRHRVDQRSGGQPHLVAGQHVGGDYVQRNPRVFDSLDRRVLLDQPPQAGAGNEVTTRAEESERAAQRVEREDLAAV